MQVKDCRKAAPKEEQVGRACESTERERTHASGRWLGSLPKVGPKGESRSSGKVENRKLGRAEDRLTEGWPEGRSIGDDASQRLPQGSSEGGAGRESL